MGGRHQAGELYAAFLRGINVGGARPLPMAELRDLASGLGCTGVRTYIASGNLLVRTSRGLAIGQAIEAAIADRFGYEVPVMLRTVPELRAALAANPFSEADGTRYVGFCASAPPDTSIDRIDPKRSPDDRFAVVGREIFLAYADGLGRSKLTLDHVESALGTPVTLRNVRTIERVLALAETV